MIFSLVCVCERQRLEYLAWGAVYVIPNILLNLHAAATAKWIDRMLECILVRLIASHDHSVVHANGVE
jgi:hypothetical protein